MDETTIAGRYRLGEVLGRGGMGTVRRAHDERLGRDVAIKTVDLSEAHDATVGDRFTREAQVTASLAHPNIVTVHDFGVEGETGYLVMELLSDPTLADLLRERGTLTVPQAADVARQVAEALAAAHARGVVHRDVKPSNIVVGPTGRVRVLDFGITRIVDEATSTQLTAAQEVVGSPDYMSPEHARGEAVDARSDLYALGCVAYQMVAGEPPLNGATPMATLLRQVNDEPTPLTEVAPGTPAWYSDLVDALLAKDPADRPADASAVVARVREGVRGAGGASVPLVADAAPTERLDAVDSTRVMPAARQPVRPAAPVPVAPAPAPAPVRRPVAPARRGSTLPWVVGLLLLATLAALAWFLVAGRDDEPRSPVTTTRTRTTTPSSSTPPATSQQSSSTTPPTQTTTQAPPSTSTPTSSSTPPPTTTPPTTPSAPPTSAPPTSTSAPTSTPAPSTSAPAAPSAETASPSS